MPNTVATASHVVAAARIIDETTTAPVVLRSATVYGRGILMVEAMRPVDRASFGPSTCGKEIRIARCTRAVIATSRRLANQRVFVSGRNRPDGKRAPGRPRTALVGP